MLGAEAPAEVYVPYVRVTNSYNGTRALRFDVGFCRKLCANGVIFETDTIRFVYAHLRREVGGDPIRFEIQPGQLERLAERFRNFVRHARSLPMAEEESREELRRVVGYPSYEAIREMSDVRRRVQSHACIWVTYELPLFMVAIREYIALTGVSPLRRLAGSAVGRGPSQGADPCCEAGAGQFLERSPGRWWSP